MKNNVNKVQDAGSILYALFASIAIVASSIIGMVAIVIMAVIIDTIIGFWRILRMKEKWSWEKFWNIWFKIVFYSLIIFTAGMIDEFILKEFIEKTINIPFFVSKVVSAFFITLEARSWDRSWKEANKGRGVKFYVDWILMHLKYYKGEIDKIIDKRKSHKE